ncbi:MAG: ribosomal protein S27ae domain protein [Bacilli bacterium]|nr:ribosomal protein S27ae domain protein [Bacilli bacterium]
MRSTKQLQYSKESLEYLVFISGVKGACIVRDLRQHYQVIDSRICPTCPICSSNLRYIVLWGDQNGYCQICGYNSLEATKEIEEVCTSISATDLIIRQKYVITDLFGATFTLSFMKYINTPSGTILFFENKKEPLVSEFIQMSLTEIKAIKPQSHNI